MSGGAWGWGGGRQGHGGWQGEGRDSKESPGWGSAFVVLAVKRTISSEPCLHTPAGDTGGADPAVPSPSPVQTSKSALSEHPFTARARVQVVGWTSRLQANQTHIGWWCCLLKSGERGGQAAI